LAESAAAPAPAAIATRGLNLWYGDFQALFDVNLDVRQGIITSLIGPSGCGKSTLLRSCNRINERLGYGRTTGSIEILGQDIYAAEWGVVQVGRQEGMVSRRRATVRPASRDHVSFGHRLHARGRQVSRSRKEELVEDALRKVLLWDSVKDRLDTLATELSLEAQQKLCIARLLPVKPAVLLMDEPCSALDPKGTEAVEELIWELRGEFTILIVTHNMAQARRASEETVFMLIGKVIEHGLTEDIFLNPQHRQTADYIEGRYG